MSADGLALPSKAAAIARLLLVAAVLVGLLVLVVTSGIDAATIAGWVDASGWAAPVLFVVVYAALTVSMVPGAVLTAAAGLLFGAVFGTALAVVGATVGGTLAFLLARRVGRGAVQRLESAQVARVDGWLTDRGLLAVLTLRLVPLVPFSAANWAAGVTGVRLRDFVIGTAFGIVPATFAYTLLGANLADPTQPAFLAAAGGLALLSILGAVALRRQPRPESDAAG